MKHWQTAAGKNSSIFIHHKGTQDTKKVIEDKTVILLFNRPTGSAGSTGKPE
jgi:hypothetical protein